MRLMLAPGDPARVGDYYDRASAFTGFPPSLSRGRYEGNRPTMKTHMDTAGDHRSGFSLIEVVIVIVIIGTISGIAIPRLSQGASNAAQTSLRADLALIRGAIEFYRAEHDCTPPTDASTIVAQLTMYTNSAGATSATWTTEYRFGPYLREMPAIQVGLRKGSNAVRDTGTPGTGTEGWFYETDTGDIFANCTVVEVDTDGVPYNTY